MTIPPVLKELAEQAETWRARAGAIPPEPVGQAGDEVFRLWVGSGGWLHRVEVNVGIGRFSAHDLEGRFGIVLRGAQQHAAGTMSGPFAVGGPLGFQAWSGGQPAGEAERQWAVATEGVPAPTRRFFPDPSLSLAELARRREAGWRFVPAPRTRGASEVTVGPVTLILGEAGTPVGLRLGLPASDLVAAEVADAIMAAQRAAGETTGGY